MIISIQYAGKYGDMPVMNIEHDASKYQLYLSYDYCVHLDKDCSTLFISSNNLKSCLDCSILSKKTRAFFQSVIIYGSFYEVLHRAGICQDFDNIEMKLLSAFIYSSLDYHCIQYECQYDYLQLQNKLLPQMQRINDPQLRKLKSGEIHLSEQTQYIYLKFDPNEVREFDYSKYISGNNKNYFVYNLMWILIHYYYPTENSFMTYEEFIKPDEYPYQGELKNKIIEAFGNTKEIQNSFLLYPQELFDFLYHRFNVSLLSKEQTISHLHSISLQSNILQELSLLIQES